MKWFNWKSFKSFYSKIILDVVEMFPPFNKGFVYNLQRIRNLQRRESEITYESSQLPEDMELDFNGFQLFLPFHIEEFNNLSLGLKRLFNDFKSVKEKISSLENSQGNISTISWSHIGIIYGEPKDSFKNSSNILVNLPEEVKYIGINLVKPLPSFFVINFNVFLKENSTKKFNSIIEKRYLSEVVFKSFFPWKIKSKGYEQFFTKNSLQSAIYDYLDELTSSVKKCLYPYFHKKFSFSQLDTNKIFTSVYFFSIFNDKSRNETAENWIRQNNWIDYLGFNTAPLNTFKSDNGAIVFNNFLDHYSSTFTTFFFKESKPDDIDQESYIEIVSEALSWSYPLYKVLEELKGELEKDRLIILERMKSRFTIIGVNKSLKLNYKILYYSMLIERFSVEFDQRKSSILKMMEALNESKRGNKDNVNLRNFLVDIIRSQIDFLDSHVFLIKKHYSDYIQFKNMRIMLQLQSRIFWLTLIVTIATILTVLLNLDSLKKLLF